VHNVSLRCSPASYPSAVDQREELAHDKHSSSKALDSLLAGKEQGIFM
jgi:hypothetical protein